MSDQAAHYQSVVPEDAHHTGGTALTAAVYGLGRVQIPYIDAKNCGNRRPSKPGNTGDSDPPNHPHSVLRSCKMQVLPWLAESSRFDDETAPYRSNPGQIRDHEQDTLWFRHRSSSKCWLCAYYATLSATECLMKIHREVEQVPIQSSALSESYLARGGGGGRGRAGRGGGGRGRRGGS